LGKTKGQPIGTALNERKADGAIGRVVRKYEPPFLGGADENLENEKSKASVHIYNFTITI
jgi:hypothetical protein